MSIRTRIFGPGADEPLLRAKMPKGAKADTLHSVAVPRAECRRQNARGGDRHRLKAEQAILRIQGQNHSVELVNLSAGGAMVRGDLELMLWDQVGLVLGEVGEIDCAVRWLKGDCFGLEFAHETRIDCDSDDRDSLLLAVIRKSFPDLTGDPLHYPKRRAEDAPDADPENVQRRGAERHPLVWSGVVYHDYDVDPVRLRNISVTGALVHSGNDLPEGETVYLDMGKAGRLEAKVCWSRGGQSGLAFTEVFDINALANEPPSLTADCQPQAFGKDRAEPWAEGWRRSTVNELSRSLGG